MAVLSRKVDESFHPASVRWPPRHSRAAVAHMPLDPIDALLPRPPTDLAGIPRERLELPGVEVVDPEGAECRSPDGRRDSVVAQHRLLRPAAEDFARVEQHLLASPVDLMAHDGRRAREQYGTTVGRVARMEAPLRDASRAPAIRVHQPDVPRSRISIGYPGFATTIEQDRFAVGREARESVDVRVVRQPAQDG